MLRDASVGIHPARWAHLRVWPHAIHGSLHPQSASITGSCTGDPLHLAVSRYVPSGRRDYGELIVGTEAVVRGEVPFTNAEMHGTPIREYDVGVSTYLCDAE